MERRTVILILVWHCRVPAWTGFLLYAVKKMYCPLCFPVDLCACNGRLCLPVTVVFPWGCCLLCNKQIVPTLSSVLRCTTCLIQSFAILCPPSPPPPFVLHFGVYF